MSKVPYLFRICSLLTAFVSVQGDGDVLAYPNPSGGGAAARPEVQNARGAEGTEASFARPEAANTGASDALAPRHEAAAPVVTPIVPTVVPVDMRHGVEIEPGECSRTERRRQIQGKIDPAVIRTASEQLDLPLGAGRYLSVNGQTYLFCLEMHYREPGSAPGPQGWHKGVTVFDAS
jgi:hypothetical protein